MFEVFAYSANAIFPILILIFLGYSGRRIGMLRQDGVAQINRFNFRFCYAAMLFMNIYEADLSRGIPFVTIGIVMTAIVLLTLIGWAASAFLTKERSRRGVIIQAAFRSNYVIIGMILAQALVGEEGTSLVAMFQLPAVIYYNIVSVFCYSIYSDTKDKISAGRVLHSIVTNPLLQGVVAGMCALAIRNQIPLGADGLPVFTLAGSLPWLYSVLQYLSRMCSPLALIVLGAGLRISDAGAFMKELVGSIVLRLIIAPAVGFSVVILAKNAGLVELTPGVVVMLLTIMGSPLATATAIMAKEMHADDSLAGQAVVWTSVLSMLTLFVQVMILRSVGWL